jgi:hypothetical protein
MVTITAVGLESRARFLNGATPVTAFTYMAVGSGTTAESTAHTALVTEIAADGLERVAATCTYVADYTTRWDKTFACTGTHTVTEIGIFNDPTAGNMYLRHKFTAGISLVTGQNIRFIIDDVQAQA